MILAQLESLTHVARQMNFVGRDFNKVKTLDDIYAKIDRYAKNRKTIKKESYNAMRLV